MTDLRDRLAGALAPRYIVDRELAAGGMGIVYLGHDPTLGREVAIKVLPPERATAVAVERFLREARLLARLAHPHIVPILEASQAGALIWFVMPRVEGDTLAHRLQNGPLPAEQVQRIGGELLTALEHAHAHGVIHRDIKPSNVFLQGEHALLADFGVALLAASAGEALTGTDQVVGTVRYMAPEQHSGGDATERSDIYGLGVTLFEAATGQRWGVGDTTRGRVWRVVPARLRRALRGALDPDPERRWRDAATFRRALAAPRRGPPRAVWWAGSATAVAAIAFGIFRPRSVATDRADLIVLPFAGAGDSLGSELTQRTMMPISYSPIRLVPWLIARRVALDTAGHLAHLSATGTFISRAGVHDLLKIQVYDSTLMSLDEFTVPGRRDDLPAWGQAIADSLVRRFYPARLPEFRLFAGVRPTRLAFDAFVDGQRRFQAGDWHGAEIKFEEAEANESLFVPALWQRLLARQWQGEPFEQELTRLSGYGDRVPQPLRELVQLQLEPDLRVRMAGFDSLARLPQYRAYSMVREMQANELFSRGPLIGRPLRDGIDSFRLAARQVPDLDQATTYTMTVWGAVRLGDKAVADEQLALRKAPKDDQWTNILWLAVKGRFQRWVAVLAREVMLATASASDIVTLKQAARMGLDVDDPWDQDAIAQTLVRRATSDSDRASALAAQATALLLVGRPEAAIERIDRGARLVPRNAGYQLQRGEWRVLLPLLPGASISIAEHERNAGRQILRDANAESPVWPRAAWALAVDAIDRGDSRTADSLIRLLRVRATAPGVADLAAFAEAFALGARNNPDSALGLTRRVFIQPNEAEAGARGPFVRAMIYLHRGEWQLRRDSLAAAERAWLWHENNDLRGRPSGEPEEGELDAALSAVARLIRAEHLPALDRAREACAMLERVNDLWRDAEAVMRPLLVRVMNGRRSCRS